MPSFQRYRSLSAVTACLALALFAASAAEAKPPKEEKPPNVILIVTDDQTLEAMNERTMPETLERLGKKGTTFTDAIATTPLCCPSRASILTGQYGHNHGVLDNKYRLLVGKRNLLPHWLRKAGYTTIHIGRYMNGYERLAKARTRVAPGWDQWHSLIKPRRYYGYTLSINGGERPYAPEPENYLTTVLTERAEMMINRFGPKRRPFFMQFDHFAPHTSGGEERGGECVPGAIPGPQDEQTFANETLPRPASFNEEDISDKPSFIRNAPQLSAEQIASIQRRYRCALGSLREVDRSVAAIDQALKENGARKRTVMIFFSDNGFYYGEHRIPVSKNYPYSEALHMPLMIRAPKKYLNGKEAPRRVSEPVANIDLAPTILALAETDPCKKAEGHRCRTMDGRSLLGLMRGRSGTAKSYPTERGLLVELNRGGGVSFGEEGDGTCAYQGIHVQGLRYIQHTAALDPATGTCVPIDERELYDLRADPFELSNQATQSSSLTPASEQQLALAERLERLKICAGIKGRDRHVDGRPFCE